jgi:hypothetical protein
MGTLTIIPYSPAVQAGMGVLQQIPWAHPLRPQELTDVVSLVQFIESHAGSTG